MAKDKVVLTFELLDKFSKVIDRYEAENAPLTRQATKMICPKTIRFLSITRHQPHEHSAAQARP